MVDGNISKLVVMELQSGRRQDIFNSLMESDKREEWVVNMVDLSKADHNLSKADHNLDLSKTDVSKANLEQKVEFTCECEWYTTFRKTGQARIIRCVVCHQPCSVTRHEHTVLFERTSSTKPEKDYTIAFDRYECLKRYMMNKYETIHAYTARVNQREAMTQRGFPETFFFPIAPHWLMSHFVPGGIPVEEAHTLAQSRHIVDLVPPVYYSGKET
jgi:hypothetical protein